MCLFYHPAITIRMHGLILTDVSYICRKEMSYFLSVLSAFMNPIAVNNSVFRVKALREYKVMRMF